jgi:hypothetical protein
MMSDVRCILHVVRCAYRRPLRTSGCVLHGACCSMHLSPYMFCAVHMRVLAFSARTCLRAARLGREVTAECSGRCGTHRYPHGLVVVGAWQPCECTMHCRTHARPPHAARTAPRRGMGCAVLAGGFRPVLERGTLRLRCTEPVACYRKYGSCVAHWFLPVAIYIAH